MEVPLAGSDSTRWIVVSVPAPRIPPASKCSCPAPANAAGAVLVPSDSNKARDRFIIWRIHESSPSIMEVVQLSAHQDFPSHGLQLSFEEALCPFADVLPIEVNNGQGLYFSLTIVATSGIVYVVKLPVSTELWSGFMVSSSNLIMRDLSNEFSGLQRVTAFAAAKNILFAGGQNGSVLCFSLFADANASQNSCYELKGGDAGLSRLWGFVSRGRTVASVKSLGVHEIHNRAVVFALHEDGGLQAWDPLHHVRLFSHNVCPSAELAVSSALRMWIEDGSFAASTQLAILFGKTQENERQTICLYSLDPLSSSGLQLGLPTLQQVIPLDQYTVLDVKLVQGSLWLLKKTGENSHELVHLKLQLGVLPQHYHLQEEELCEQLVCSENNEPDDLPALPGLSELFLRRLLQPRVFHPETAQEVLRARGAAMNDLNLRTFTEDDWRREFSSLLGNEANRHWNDFIAEYVNAWRKNHIPYALLSDATTGCMGLVRKSSLSLIRSQTRIEKASSVISSPFVDGKESQVLTALVRCMREISSHIGPLSLAIFNETLLQREGASIDQLVSTYVRSLEIGPSSPPVSQSLGLDDLRQKVKKRHLKQQKFKFRVSQTLREIGTRAGGWAGVFEFIASYENFLLYGSTQRLCSVSTSGNGLTKLITQATSQVLWAHYEESRNLILLLKFVVSLKGQVNLTSHEAAKIQLEIYPRLKKIMLMNFLLYWLTVAPGESPQSDDFNSLLSSLRIDGKNNNAWTGNPDFGQITLAEILATSFFDAAPVTLRQHTGVLIEKADLLDFARGFITWLSLGEESTLKFPRRVVALSVILLQHGQYRGLEEFLAIVEKFSNDQAYHDDNMDGESSARLHLFGLCLLARACSGPNETGNSEQIKEASSCFFRAAEGLGDSSDVFHSVFNKMAIQQYDPAAQASLKLHYFEWVMQLFEQYNLSEVATEFALAAIDQVDKASNMKDASGTKGRLWANIFKFSMDLDLYGPAYSAIISNPDEEVKLTCLRRFVVVLCERKAVLTLCGGDFPYAGLLEIVEQELAWKAEYSEIRANPSPYKLLYGFHVHRHNYRRAAECMYRYASRMRNEGVSKSRMQASIALQEEVNGLAAAINSLRLVSSSFAWMNGEFLAFSTPSSPSKRLRLSGQANASAPLVRLKEEAVVDVEELEKQYVIASAKLELVQANVRHPTIGDLSPAEVVALLVQNGLYNTAFTTVFKIWKDSVLKRELEKVFELMARNCCTTGLLTRPPNEKLLALPDVGRFGDKHGDVSGTKSSWNSLQTNLEKFRSVHPRLPVIVAETLLSVNKNMELPIWLVEMLKASRSTSSELGLGMAGQGDPAALLRIYIDNGRLIEASMLVLDYLRAWANMVPSDILKRKQMSAAWFPYMLIDRLLQSLSELSDSDPQCAELRTSLHTALQNHLKQAKEDSDDVISLVNHA